jgi:hypothetical protein
LILVYRQENGREVLGMVGGQVGRGKDITATRLSLRSQLSKMRTHNSHARNSVRADGRRSPFPLHDNLANDATRGRGVALGRTAAQVRLLAVEGESGVGETVPPWDESLGPYLVRDVVAGVGVGQSGHVAVRRI